jgi:predicted dehydrogenase
MEQVAYWHYCHSYVRGNWRRSELASPLVMQKSCHDMDLLVWLTGSRCESIASFGDLTYFKAENAPTGAAERCSECPLKDSCRFSAYRCYLPVAGNWPATVLTEDQSEEGIRVAIQNGPYGRCVYHCDNNVCDHMSIIMEFDNEVTGTFSLTAQTSACHRNIHIMLEHGEIIADDGQRQILVRKHVSSPGDSFEERILNIRTNASGHGGGDAGIMEDFTASLTDGEATRSAISASVESHLMAFALEQSRITGKAVELEEFRKSLM